MILLDTQIVAWLAFEPEKISRNAAAAISQARSGAALAIADKTLWELAMMIRRGRINLEGSLRDLLDETEQRFVVLPLNAAIAERSVQFSKGFPSDPADQIIAATALIHGLALVTADTQIRNSGEVRCIW